MPDSNSTFPADFVWGAATASYQIEGAAHADGRGESVWDRFGATPGKVRNGDTGEIACDFYHRYPEDAALMADLGLDAFRFSIAWPRVLPEGRGRVNQAGLDFYDRLVDELLAHQIEPFATLFHWDLPQALEDEGGMRVRSTAEAYVEYTEAVVARLGDRVQHWITHNEPWVYAWVGNAWGWHAPGRTSEADAVAVAHHLLLSHGWAVQAIRRLSPEARVGITLNLTHVYPATESPEDEAAAYQRDVFLVEVIVVVRDVAVLVVLDLPRGVGKRVPDRDALPVLVPRAFDLVRGRGDTPEEPVREAALGGRGRSDRDVAIL